MNNKSYLTRSIENADDKAQYDAYAKKIVSDKTILSWIAKYAVKELKDYSISEIMACIEGEPEVAFVPVDPGAEVKGREGLVADANKRDANRTEAIIGLPTEDKVPGEGSVTYDIRFYLRLPSKDRIKIIVNVEIQKNFYPGYDLVTRALFYCARMLSAQLDTEFMAENYDGIKKVYSIWLCLNSPQYLTDTITSYSIRPESIVGEVNGDARYDIMSAVIICLNEKSYQKKETPLHGLLGTIFSEKLDSNEKVKILNQDYGIETTREVKEGMSKMCNLSDAIEERGIKKGIEQGIEQGLQQGIKLIILDNIEDGKTREVIIEKLIRHFSLTSDEAEKYYEKYSDVNE